MVSIKKYYYVETKTDEINLNVQQFVDNDPLPIIWNNRGLYRIIPIERVKNKIDLLIGLQSGTMIDYNPSMGKFFWEEGVEVDGKTIALLL